jgi:hypothetical protein
MKNTIIVISILLFYFKICFCSAFFNEAPRQFILHPLLFQQTELSVSGNEVSIKNVSLKAKDMKFVFRDDNYYSIIERQDSIIRYDYIQDKNMLILDDRAGIAIYIDFEALMYCLQVSSTQSFSQSFVFGTVKAEI